MPEASLCAQVLRWEEEAEALGSGWSEFPVTQNQTESSEFILVSDGLSVSQGSHNDIPSESPSTHAENNLRVMSSLNTIYGSEPPSVMMAEDYHLSICLPIYRK